jgi:acylphosphatase
MAKKRLYLKIFGRVQGVGFRYWASGVAKNSGLKGWIKNVGEKTVEGEIEGEEKSLEEFLEWAKKGSRWARVEKVEARWEEFKGEFGDFKIKF